MQNRLCRRMHNTTILIQTSRRNRLRSEPKLSQLSGFGSMTILETPCSCDHMGPRPAALQIDFRGSTQSVTPRITAHTHNVRLRNGLIQLSSARDISLVRDLKSRHSDPSKSETWFLRYCNVPFMSNFSSPKRSRFFNHRPLVQ